MKRLDTLTLFFIILSAFMAIPVNGQEIGKCMLQHNGTVTVHDGRNMAAVVSQAAEGDTIFLTEGSFPGFKMEKKMTIRGAGDSKTKIYSNIEICIPGKPTLDQTLLEGLYHLDEKTVTCSSTMSKLKIKQCRLYDLVFTAANYDIVIDRCNIWRDLKVSPSCVKGITCLNSSIRTGFSTSFRNGASNAYFVNCDVETYYMDYVAGDFLNCVIFGHSSGSSTGHTLKFLNCNFTNCYRFNKTALDVSSSSKNGWTNSAVASWPSINYLLEKKMLGDDGTIIGCMGGINPYSFTLPVPKVTDKTIILDQEKRVLNVNIKVSAE